MKECLFYPSWGVEKILGVKKRRKKWFILCRMQGRSHSVEVFVVDRPGKKRRKGGGERKKGKIWLERGKNTTH